MTPLTKAEAVPVSQEYYLRADLYDFLGLLLSAPPDRALLEQTSNLSGDGSDLGQSINRLAKLARLTKPLSAEREFNDLFIGLGRGELLPFASYYMTGFLNEKPLALLRHDMASRGLTRAANAYEPEDNIASLMEMMAALITGRHAGAADLGAQRDFFNRHIGPWASHFFADLEAAKASVFYAGIGVVGRVFMEIEAEGFRLSAA